MIWLLLLRVQSWTRRHLGGLQGLELLWQETQMCRRYALDQLESAVDVEQTHTRESPFSQDWAATCWMSSKAILLVLAMCSNERRSRCFKCPYHLYSTCRVGSWRRWWTKHSQRMPIVEVDSSLKLLFGWRTSDEPDLYFSTETVSGYVLSDRVRYLWIQRTEQNQCFLC